MSLFDTCYGKYLPASEIRRQLPDYDRHDAIMGFVKDGCVPYFLRRWVELDVSQGSVPVRIWVLSDYFSLGTDEDFVRMPLGLETAHDIAKMIGAALPTPKMVDLIHQRAKTIVAQPWGPPYDQSMMSTTRIFQHNAQIESQRKALGISVGTLVSGHKKDVVQSHRHRTGRVCIYGWFRTSSPQSYIQPLNCSSHGSGYADYSHGVRFVRDVVDLNGRIRKLSDALQDPLGASILGVDVAPCQDASDKWKLLTAAAFGGIGFGGARLLMRKFS